MNTIPKLFAITSWQELMALSSGEKIELVMFVLVSILWIAGMIYGGYRMLTKKGRQEADAND